MVGGDPNESIQRHGHHHPRAWERCRRRNRWSRCMERRRWCRMRNDGVAIQHIPDDEDPSRTVGSRPRREERRNTTHTSTSCVRPTRVRARLPSLHATVRVEDAHANDAADPNDERRHPFRRLSSSTPSAPRDVHVSHHVRLLFRLGRKKRVVWCVAERRRDVDASVRCRREERRRTKRRRADRGWVGRETRRGKGQPHETHVRRDGRAGQSGRAAAFPDEGTRVATLRRRGASVRGMHQASHLVGHLGVQEPVERHERVLASTHHRTRAAETQDVVGGTRSTRIPTLGCRHPHRKGMTRPPIRTCETPVARTTVRAHRSVPSIHVRSRPDATVSWVEPLRG